MRNWVLQIKNGKPTHTSDYQTASMADYCKEHEGEYLDVRPKKQITVGQRGYIYGALAPAYCDYSENYDPFNPDHVDEAAELLLAYAHGETKRGIDGKPITIRRSTKADDMDSEEYRIGKEKIIHYFEEHSIPVPDPSLYAKWMDEWSFAEPDLNYWQWLKKNNLTADGSKKL